MPQGKDDVTRTPDATARFLDARGIRWEQITECGAMPIGKSPIHASASSHGAPDEVRTLVGLRIEGSNVDDAATKSLEARASKPPDQIGAIDAGRRKEPGPG
jgi:hypothetical protein